MNVEFLSIPNQLPCFSIALYALTILSFLVLFLCLWYNYLKFSASVSTYNIYVRMPSYYCYAIVPASVDPFVFYI